jgi:hypothetical protein
VTMNISPRRGEAAFNIVHWAEGNRPKGFGFESRRLACSIKGREGISAQPISAANLFIGIFPPLKMPTTFLPWS